MLPISHGPYGVYKKPKLEFLFPSIQRLSSRKRAEKAVLLACLGERRSKSLKEEKVAMFQAEPKKTGWWQLNILLMFTPNYEENEANLTDVIFFRWVGEKPPGSYKLKSWTCNITKNFRYLKWRNTKTYISCMDTAYVRENLPPK